MFISGTDNRFTKLEVSSLLDWGDSTVDQYEVNSWKIVNESLTTKGASAAKAAKGEILYNKNS